MTNKKISILLATYNSELFIVEQLNSIINQINSNWVLYIRDDNSTDNTKNIINMYVSKYDNIFLLNDSIKKRGSAMSFLWMLCEVESDFYMFCDHDDIWLPNKIELTYKKMIEETLCDNKVPVIVHTDLVIVDKHLNVISESFWKFSNLNPLNVSFNDLAFANCIVGCTMMINNPAKKLISIAENIDFPHDAWIGLLVSYNKGIISSIDTQTILYRQHEYNLIGINQKKSVNRKLTENLKRFRILNKITRFTLFQYISLKFLKSNSKKIKRMKYIFR